jgi:CheY-like chemotaxis protein
MPEHDGLWLIRAIRKLPSPERHVPAVAVTAYASLSERDMALEAGYNGHVAKPLDAERLVTAIASALAADRRVPM